MEIVIVGNELVGVAGNDVGKRYEVGFMEGSAEGKSVGSSVEEVMGETDGSTDA